LIAIGGISGFRDYSLDKCADRRAISFPIIKLELVSRARRLRGLQIRLAGAGFLELSPIASH
jgi:hypothetical protein